MRRPALSVLFAILLAFVAGACGGGDDNDANQSGSDSTEDAASTEEESDDEDDEEFSGEGSDDFCERIKALEESDELFSEGASPEEQQKQAEEMLEQLDGLTDDAPEEIRDDLQTLLDGLRPLLQAIADGKDLSQMTPEEQKQFEELSSAEYQAAGERVNSYVEKVCEIDTDGDGDTDGQTATTTTAGG